MTAAQQIVDAYGTNPASMKPLPPNRNDYPAGDDSDRDHAGKGKWDIGALEGMLRDIDQQPKDWRDRADYNAGYIDGKQFSPAQQRALRAEGLDDLRPTNLMAKTIRGMSGEEAKARTAVKVEADDEDNQDFCDVANRDLVELRREAKVDQAISAAYFTQSGLGIGWVKVDTDPDPLNYYHRVRFVDRRQVWWDWSALDPLLKDARWLLHQDWADLDELVAAMPQHRKILQTAEKGWANFAFATDDYSNRREVNAFEDYTRISRTRVQQEWFDSARRRIRLCEVWYRVPAIAVVLAFSPTRRVLFDETNQSHINAVVNGKCQMFKAPTSQVRCALYAGPYRLQDYGTRRRVFPYVPFFGYRDDQDRSPYGVVEGLIGPQDEYNSRRIRVNWMLRQRQIFIDDDALDLEANTLEQIIKAINRPNLTVVLNSNRKNVNGFRVEANLSLEQAQVEVMQDAKQLLQDVPGRYGSQLGQQASGVTSGIANSLLIEQGAVSMGDLNDNYRDSRQLVHEVCLDQIIDSYRGQRHEVKVGRGNSRRVVVLNDFDEEGNIINGVSDAALRVGLDEAPNTPAFRLMQQQGTERVITALAAVNPEAAAVLVPSYIEQTDMPDRMELADTIRKRLGIPTAADKKQQAAMEQQQAEEAAAQKAVQQHAITISLEDAAAKVEKTKSETELNNAKTTEIGFKMGHGQATAAHDMAGADKDRAQAATDAEQPDPAAERQRLIAEAMAEATGAPMQ